MHPGFVWPGTESTHSQVRGALWSRLSRCSSDRHQTRSAIGVFFLVFRYTFVLWVPSSIAHTNTYTHVSWTTDDNQNFQESRDIYLLPRRCYGVYPTLRYLQLLLREQSPLLPSIGSHGSPVSGSYRHHRRRNAFCRPSRTRRRKPFPVSFLQTRSGTNMIEKNDQPMAGGYNDCLTHSGTIFLTRMRFYSNMTVTEISPSSPTSITAKQLWSMP